MIELRFEWQEAPWLPIRSHARTWARLEIRVGDTCATEALHLRSKSTHEGVSLPLLPLAEWIVANWWYLLEECPLPGCGESARLAIGARERAWFERHNLLAAREGYALPDLTLSRVDDGRVQVQFAPDPGPVGVFGVQFIRGGAATVTAAALAAQLQNLLDAVADRLDGCDDADAVAFVESVEARRRMVGDDALLCARAATLGLDGADPEAVPDTLADVLVDELRDLPRGLVSDLLDHLSAVQQGHDPASLRAVAQGLREARMVPDDRFSSALGQARERLKAPLRAAKEGRPYEVGWRLARACREQLYGLPPTLVGGRLDEAVSAAPLVRLAGANGHFGQHPVRAWVRADAEGTAPVVLHATSRPAQQRFLLAASTALALLGGRERLLGHAASRSQSIARAFAAEWLAPEEAVRRALSSEVVTADELEALAGAMEVSPQVLVHQIENHHLGVVRA